MILSSVKAVPQPFLGAEGAALSEIMRISAKIYGFSADNSHIIH